MAYEAQMRQITRDLISKHGDLSEVHCVSGHNPCRIELVFADGERISVGEHTGRVDTSIMKAGYHGTGSRCFHAFLEEAGYDGDGQGNIEGGEPPYSAEENTRYQAYGQ